MPPPVFACWKDERTPILEAPPTSASMLSWKTWEPSVTIPITEALHLVLILAWSTFWLHSPCAGSPVQACRFESMPCRNRWWNGCTSLCPGWWRRVICERYKAKSAMNNSRLKAKVSAQTQPCSWPDQAWGGSPSVEVMVEGHPAFLHNGKSIDVHCECLRCNSATF
jgi:hypothetical protein